MAASPGKIKCIHLLLTLCFLSCKCFEPHTLSQTCITVCLNVGECNAVLFFLLPLGQLCNKPLLPPQEAAWSCRFRQN